MLREEYTKIVDEAIEANNNNRLFIERPSEDLIETMTPFQVEHLYCEIGRKKLDIAQEEKNVLLRRINELEYKAAETKRLFSAAVVFTIFRTGLIFCLAVLLILLLFNKLGINLSGLFAVGTEVFSVIGLIAVLYFISLVWLHFYVKKGGKL